MTPQAEATVQVHVKQAMSDLQYLQPAMDQQRPAPGGLRASKTSQQLIQFTVVEALAPHRVHGRQVHCCIALQEPVEGRGKGSSGCTCLPAGRLQLQT